MMNGITPNIKFQSSIPNFGMSMNTGMTKGIEESSGGSFKNVMSGMVSNINDQINAPDKLLSDAVTGAGNVDVHDVMIAMSKAELTLNIATNTVTKVIQAYDKISQIQV